MEIACPALLLDADGTLVDSTAGTVPLVTTRMRAAGLPLPEVLVTAEDVAAVTTTHPAEELAEPTWSSLPCRRSAYGRALTVRSLPG